MLMHIPSTTSACTSAFSRGKYTSLPGSLTEMWTIPQGLEEGVICMMRVVGELGELEEYG